MPEENAVVTSDGQTVHYKYLVVCPGIQINWDNVHCPSLLPPFLSRPAQSVE